MSENSIPQKKCTKCGNFFPASNEYFNKEPHAKDGLCGQCKACFREHRRIRYAEHPEKQREYNQRYYKEHLEKERQRCQLYREQHLEAARVRQQRYRANNIEKERSYSRRRRARKLNLPATFTLDHERLGLEYFSGRCAVCNRQLKDLFGTHTVHWDHWIPLTKGGGTTPDNMLPLCGGQGGCNQSKGAKLPEKWLLKQFGKRKAAEILAKIEAYFEWVKGQ